MLCSNRYRPQERSELERLFWNSVIIDVRSSHNIITIGNWLGNGYFRLGNVSLMISWGGLVISDWLMGNLNSWVWYADIRLWYRRIWSINCLRVVRDLLQISIRSDDVLLFAGDRWSDDGSSVVIGDSSVTDGDGCQETYKLRNEIQLFSEMLAREFRETSCAGLGWMNFKLASPPRKERSIRWYAFNINSNLFSRIWRYTYSEHFCFEWINNHKIRLS